MSDIDHKTEAAGIAAFFDDGVRQSSTNELLLAQVHATLYAAEQTHIANRLVAANILMMRVQRGHELKPSEWAIVHAATEQFEGGI